MFWDRSEISDGVIGQTVWLPGHYLTHLCRSAVEAERQSAQFVHNRRLGNKASILRHSATVRPLITFKTRADPVQLEMLLVERQQVMPRQFSLVIHIMPSSVTLTNVKILVDLADPDAPVVGDHPHQTLTDIADFVVVVE